jgi:hypothetical protein
MIFLKATQNYVASMSVDDTQSIKWHVDAAFAVHKDYKSHTGATHIISTCKRNYLFFVYETESEHEKFD